MPFSPVVSARYPPLVCTQVLSVSDFYYAVVLVSLVTDGNTAITPLAYLNCTQVTVQFRTKSVSFLASNYPQVQLVEVEKNQ